jgi:hypothetical protein
MGRLAAAARRGECNRAILRLRTSVAPQRQSRIGRIVPSLAPAAAESVRSAETLGSGLVDLRTVREPGEGDRVVFQLIDASVVANPESPHPLQPL